MAFLSIFKAACLGVAGVLVFALAVSHTVDLVSHLGLMSFVTDFPIPDFPFLAPFNTRSPRYQVTTPICAPSAYHTEFVSLDPLLIYIHGFLHADEVDALLITAESLFKPSTVTTNGRKVSTPDRTSSSASLPLRDPTVQCVLARAMQFMGTILRDGDEIGPPQLVRYTAGQQFSVHHDWYDTPQRAYDGSRRTFNRVASFFAILQDNCTGGETYFPHITRPPGHVGYEGALGHAGSKSRDEVDPPWRVHEDGGLLFRPVRGNALFWVNLQANGTGDERTVHAGLPVGEGLKTAMNIWPRQFHELG